MANNTHILIVDDDDRIRTLLKDYLSSKNYIVSSAENAVEAKKKIKYSFNPHLLPTFRGILTSIYLKKKSNVSLGKIRNELIKFYKKSKFIKILKLNSEIG